MAARHILGAFALALALISCAEDSETTCDGAIADAMNAFGTPDNVRETVSDDYSVTTLSWPGRIRTFIGTDDGCEVSNTTF